MVVGGIVAFLWGGTMRGRIYYAACAVMGLVGLMLALGLEKFLEMVCTVIEWIIDKITGGGGKK